MSRPKKPTPSTVYASAVPRELLGITDDGRLVLWDTGRVIPVTQFAYRRDRGTGRRWIDDGHFVIDWAGEEVTAHLGNLSDGRVSVLLMCHGGRGFALSRREARRLLRYKVIRDPEAEADILTRLQALVRLVAKSRDTPDRQRGAHRHQSLFQPAGSV